MNPNLRHLEVFRLFSRVMSVTETARLLRITQPSVSQALRDLENQLGLELIIRGQGPLKLTANADLLLKNMEDVLDNMQALRERAARLRGEQDNSLAIASVHPLTGWILPQALARLKNSHPHTRIALEAYSSREVIKHVQDRTADIGFTFLPVDNPDMVVRPLMMTEMVCLLPKNHALAGSVQLTPETLDNETIITFGQQVRQEFDVRLAFGNGNEAGRFLTTNLSVVSADLVRQGLGIAITLPFVLTPRMTQDIAVSAFRPEIRRSLVAIYLRKPGLSALGKAFLAQVREENRGFAAHLDALGVFVKPG
ncbi:LysR family transcriptional regulator [Neorhizobium petrolearium]|uniref:LysR family transcriptional regulator n=1 Tax=Neorhizobium petrolearium TaxID=515361 RepID=UPI003F18CE62